MEKIFPKNNDSGSIGKSGVAWLYGYFKYLVLNGITYLWPAADGTSGQVLSTDGSGTLAWSSTGAATAFDDIGDADGAGTVSFSTFAQTLTSAKTDGDMLTISGLGNFGDVSVVRIEQKTGNPTDGTVLEVVSADANCDPLLVSANGAAGCFVVNQSGNVTASGTATITGLISSAGGIAVGSSTTSILKTDTVAVTNAQIKALRGSKKELVATPGAGKWLEFISAELILDYGSNVLTESDDNLVIQYATSGVDATAAIETTGFIDSNADIIMYVPPKAIGAVAATDLVNNALELFNTGDGEFGGNAGADTVMTVKITYRIHATGL